MYRVFTLIIFADQLNCCPETAVITANGGALIVLYSVV